MQVKKSLLLLVLLASLGSVLSAQTSPAALTPSSMYVGALPTTVNPDWGCVSNSPFSCFYRQLFGVEAYAGLNHIKGRFGAEADLRYLSWRGVSLASGKLKETNYLIGPTFHLVTRRSFSVGGNVLFGIGSITIPKGYGPGQGSYFIYSPSLHVDERITDSIHVRYEYEYQLWPSFSGTLGNHGLTPNGLGVGITYHLHPRYY